MLAAGCWPRQSLIRPAGTLSALREDGSEATGASFHIWRFNLTPTPSTVSDRWQVDGDEHGRAQLTRLQQSKWVWLFDDTKYVWNVCVDAPGFRPTQMTWLTATEKAASAVVDLSLPLHPGNGSCDEPKFQRLWLFETPE